MEGSRARSPHGKMAPRALDPLVLHKLGHDLGGLYGGIVREPAPDRLRLLVRQIMGGKALLDYGTESRRAPAPGLGRDSFQFR